MEHQTRVGYCAAGGKNCRAYPGQAARLELGFEIEKDVWIELGDDVQAEMTCDNRAADFFHTIQYE